MGDAHQDRVRSWLDDAQQDLPLVAVRARPCRQMVNAELHAAAAASDHLDGWSPGCGRAHPGGGYTRRVVGEEPTVSSVEYLSDAVFNHRTDGPAQAWWDRYGRLEAVEYRDQGAPHRTDGPASVGTGRGHWFHLWGRPLGAGIPAVDLGRFEALVAAGSAPGDAVAWMDLQEVLSAQRVDELVSAGGRAWQVHGMWRFGVDESAALVAVGLARAPASWAAPGRTGPVRVSGANEPRP